MTLMKLHHKKYMALLFLSDTPFIFKISMKVRWFFVLVKYLCLQIIFRFDFRMLGFKHLQENIVEISAVALSQIQKDR